MYYRLLLLLVVLGWGATSTMAQEQSPEIVIINTVPTARSDGSGLDLAIYFALRDKDGNAIPRETADVPRNGTLAIENFAQSVETTIDAPDTPIAITLMIDTSGSMRDAMGSVRTAAIEAVKSAPEGTRFTVFTFDTLALDDDWNPLISLEDNREEVVKVIDAIAVTPDGQTCLFNAATRAVGYLNDALPEAQDRRAIILFTDGRDSTGRTDANGNNVLCSTFDDQSVINAANEENRTPIHTIGLCTDTACSNVDTSGLDNLAKGTAGSTQTGTIDQINDRFKQIMATINAQWVARGTVLPRMGENVGVLAVILAGEPQSETFTFLSERDFNPPPEVALTAQYASETDRYSLTLQLTNRDSIGSLSYQIFDEARGTFTPAQLIALPAQQTSVTFPVPGEDLTSDRKYRFQIVGTDREGKALKNVAGGSNAAVLADLPITHTISPQLKIKQVIPDYDGNELRIKVETGGLGTRQTNIGGEVLQDGNQVVLIRPLLLPENNEITIAWPVELQRRAGEYMVRLELDLNPPLPIPIQRDMLFRYDPPPAPTPWALYALILVGCLGSVCGVWLYRQRQRPVELPEIRVHKEKEPAPPALVAAPTLVVVPTPVVAPAPDVTVRAANVRVRVEIVTSVVPQPVSAHSVTRFPCLIGRGGKSTLVIAGDPKISREHVEISCNQGMILLTDKSTHGTFIDQQQIPQRVARAITGPTLVKLGPDTTIQITPE